MPAPDSASFRCLNALRYLVLSYVTSPTTINAITEIPAKTPRPIGSTDSFLPGRVKAAVAVVDAEADTFAAAAVPEGAASAAAVPAETLETPSSDIAPCAAGAPEAAGEPEAAEDVATAPAGMVETPLSEIAPPSAADVCTLAKEVDAADAAIEAPAIEDASTVETPSSEIAPVEEDSAALDVAVDSEESVDVALPFVDVAVEESTVEEVDAEESDPDEELESSPLDPLFEDSMVIVHVLTSCTTCWPLLSTTGVRVIVHVCVIVPAAVTLDCDVWTVVEFDAARGSRRGRAFTGCKRTKRPSSRKRKNTRDGRRMENMARLLRGKGYRSRREEPGPAVFSVANRTMPTNAL